MHDFVYLASQSPRRRQLLDQLGIRHELLLAGPDEDAEALEAHRAGEPPLEYCERVTRLKLEAALARLRARGWPPAPVLCADTTVALGQRIFGKPVDAADACATLERLAGRTHRVITAVAVARTGSARRRGSIHARSSVSTVRFAPLPAAVIADYVASGEPFGKAGAYAIQSRLAAWIERITGSYSGIMGLPLFEAAQLLAAAGVTVRMLP
ncbi:MAG TPA: Maf family protein [Burkholderiaceae bacterium]|jgi:septum formation protein|nr:Maf family protein [Burkholderiaceae bacterium]